MPEPTDFPMRWVDWGQGTRKAIAVHCSLAHSGEWRGMAPVLGQVFSLSAPDLPSHGLSGDWSPEMGDYHDLATALITARAQELAAGGQIDLIGHSLGGTLVLRVALENPGLVRSLVLIEPVLFASIPREIALADNGPYLEALAAGHPEEAAKVFVNAWGAAWDDLPERQREYSVQRMYVVNGTTPAIADDRPGLVVPGRPEGLDIPVLLIAGGETTQSARAIVDTMASRFPRAEVEIVEGAGHMLPVTHADAVSAAILRFAASVEATA